MKRDKQAVIWTRLAGQPVKMGRLYLTASECRFSYELGYLSLQQPGLGVLYPPSVVQDNTIIRPRSHFFDFLPPIQSLLPPRGEHNLQRNLILSYLAKKGIQTQKGFELEWEILKVAGHGGIGHLDVFETDEKAQEWYTQVTHSELFEVDEATGFSLKEMLSWLDKDASELINIIGPTPSVGGAIPKILLSIPDTGWDNRVGLPTRGYTPERLDVVVKFEQAASYPGINALEALCLDVHREAGFDVPRYWLGDLRGVPVLAIERFDRTALQQPSFTETLYSVLASGDGSITDHYSYSYDRIGRAMDRSPIPLVADVKQAKRYMFKRLLMSMLTGNGDLHLENMSISGHQNHFMFSPVYDPTPMRAYAVHDMLSVMPFGNYGEWPDSQKSPTGMIDALLQLSRNLGIKQNEVNAITSHLLGVTENYTERVRQLEAVPEANRENLVTTVTSVRQQIQQSNMIKG